MSPPSQPAKPSDAPDARVRKHKPDDSSTVQEANQELLREASALASGSSGKVFTLAELKRMEIAVKSADNARDRALTLRVLREKQREARREADAAREHTSRENAATREHQSREKQADREHTSRENAAIREHQSREKQADREHTSRENAATREHNLNMQRDSQNWQSGEKQADREHQSGENAATREHQSRERQADREHQSGENAATREHQSREKQADREHQSRENAATREHNLNMQRDSQNWQSGEKRADREHQSRENAATREHQSRENAATRSHQSDENALDRDLKDRDRREGFSWKTDERRETQDFQHEEEALRRDYNREKDALDRDKELEIARYRWGDKNAFAANAASESGGHHNAVVSWGHSVLHPDGRHDFKFGSSGMGRGGGSSESSSHGGLGGPSGRGGYGTLSFSRRDADGGLRRANELALPDWRPVDTWEPDEEGNTRDFSAADFYRHSDSRRSGRFQGGYLDPGFHDAYIAAKVNGLQPGDALYERTRAAAEASYQRAMTKYSDEWQKYGRSVLNDQAARAARDNPGNAPLRTRETAEERQMREADDMIAADFRAAARRLAYGPNADQADESGGATKTQIGPTREAAEAQAAAATAKEPNLQGNGVGLFGTPLGAPGSALAAMAAPGFGLGGGAGSVGAVMSSMSPTPTKKDPPALNLATKQVLDNTVRDMSMVARVAPNAFNAITGLQTHAQIASDRVVNPDKPVQMSAEGPTIESAKANFGEVGLAQSPQKKKEHRYGDQRKLDGRVVLTGGQSKNPAYASRVTKHTAVYDSKTGRGYGRATLEFNNTTDNNAQKPLYMFNSYAATYGAKEAARRFFGGKIPTEKEIQQSAADEMARRRAVRAGTYRRPNKPAAAKPAAAKPAAAEPAAAKPAAAEPAAAKPAAPKEIKWRVTEAPPLPQTPAGFTPDKVTQPLTDAERKRSQAITTDEIGRMREHMTAKEIEQERRSRAGLYSRTAQSVKPVELESPRRKVTQPLTDAERKRSQAITTDEIGRMREHMTAKEIERERRLRAGQNSRAAQSVKPVKPVKPESPRRAAYLDISQITSGLKPLPAHPSVRKHPSADKTTYLRAHPTRR